MNDPYQCCYEVAKRTQSVGAGNSASFAASNKATPLLLDTASMKVGEAEVCEVSLRLALSKRHLHELTEKRSLTQQYTA